MSESESEYVLRQSQSGLTGTVYVDGQQVGAVRRRGPRNWNALRAGHWQASRVPFISADAAAQMVVVWATRGRSRRLKREGSPRLPSQK